MEINDTEGPLRATANLLFGLSRELDGQGPALTGGWYKLSHRDGSGYAWLRLIGDRATRFPRQSVHVVVFPHPEFQADQRLSVGRDWWSKEDRHFVAHAGNAGHLAVAVELIAKAFWIDEGRPS